jgi:hypothetical protein
LNAFVIAPGEIAVGDPVSLVSSRACTDRSSL